MQERRTTKVKRVTGRVGPRAQRQHISLQEPAAYPAEPQGNACFRFYKLSIPFPKYKLVPPPSARSSQYLSPNHPPCHA